MKEFASVLNPDDPDNLAAKQSGAISDVIIQFTHMQNLCIKIISQYLGKQDKQTEIAELLQEPEFGARMVIQFMFSLFGDKLKLQTSNKQIEVFCNIRNNIVHGIHYITPDKKLKVYHKQNHDLTERISQFWNIWGIMIKDILTIQSSIPSLQGLIPFKLLENNIAEKG